MEQEQVHCKVIDIFQWSITYEIRVKISVEL